MTPRLRPMDLGDLLDTTFALYRRNFALFAGVVAVMEIPAALINLLLLLSFSPTGVLTNSSGTPVVNVGAFAGSFGLAFGGRIVSFMLSTLASGALAVAVSARYLDRPITVEGAYRALGSQRFFLLFFATILEAIILGFSLILFVIPFIYFIVRFIFIPQAIVLEGTGIRQAFGRSGQLVSGSWWRVFGIGLVLIILVGILQAVIGGAIGAILSLGSSTGARILSTVLSALVGILVRPVELGALTLLYYDLRIRKEGFDLEQMASALESSPTR